MDITEEQQAVICHKQGAHARVLAVAGSGKTSTMAFRIKNLVIDQGVSPEKILVLMFNRLARQQFSRRLFATSLPPFQHPKIYTFHAFAYRFIKEMERIGIIPRHIDLWINQRAELERIYVSKAIENLERRSVIRPSEIDIQEAMNAIGLWKSFLIPPESAGHHVNQNIAAVYAEFEGLRKQKNALTFDDFVPLAVHLLKNDAQLKRNWCERMDHIIVDEYQDVNYGQQQLIELLAGQRADVMVVGDDDQTIYEWRGARPQYITSEFKKIFNNKPNVDYNLSHTFRFGPILAQGAYNCISQNQERVSKHLVAHFIERETNVHVYQMELSDSFETAKLFTAQMLTLVLSQQVLPNQIAVLARLYAQLAPLEVELLNHKIPYNLIGSQPFFKRSENAALVNYLQIALSLEKPITEESLSWFLTIANKPLRYLPRQELASVLDHGRLFRLSMYDVLTSLVEKSESKLNSAQRLALAKLLNVLKYINFQLSENPDMPAGQLLRWLVEELEYLQQFSNYYGEGEASFERELSATYFLHFSDQVKFSVKQYIEYLAQLDTTQGEKPDQQIVLTSIFQVKGLEFDFVFVPQCYEGQLPYFGDVQNIVYDMTGQIPTSNQSPSLESERRLFYVALTRAKKAVFLEAPAYIADGRQLPSRFLEEIQLPVTRRIFEPYQRLVVYPETDPSIIFAPIKESKIPSSILETLQSYYFKHVMNDWAKEAQKIIGNVLPSPFTYQLIYKDFHAIHNAKNEQLAVPWHYLRLKLEEKPALETGIFVGDHSGLVGKEGTDEDEPVPGYFADNDETPQTLSFNDSSAKNQEVVAKLKKLGQLLQKKIFKSKGN